MMRCAPLLVCLTLLAACTSPARDPELEQLGVPPDFAVDLYVRAARGESSDNPLRQTSKTVLEANRKLRVAVGDAARANYYPKIVRIVDAPQVEQAYAIVHNANLMIEPTSPDAEAIQSGTKTGVLYQVTLTAFGRTHTYATTPTESPPTAQLLKKLVDLRK